MTLTTVTVEKRTSVSSACSLRKAHLWLLLLLSTAPEVWRQGLRQIASLPKSTAPRPSLGPILSTGFTSPLPWQEEGLTRAALLFLPCLGQPLVLNTTPTVYIGSFTTQTLPSVTPAACTPSSLSTTFYKPIRYNPTADVLSQREESSFPSLEKEERKMERKKPCYVLR